MRRMRKLSAGVLAAAFCLVSIGSNGDPTPADKPRFAPRSPMGRVCRRAWRSGPKARASSASSANFIAE